MNYFSLILIVTLASCAMASDVIELKDSNFDSKIREHEVALVKFYAPWCGHCKRMAPEFDTASVELKQHDPPVALIKVDCTTETEVCQKYGVSGYPTLKIFKNGEVSTDYNGPREADGIVKFMRTKAGPISKHLESEEAFDKYLNNNDHTVVGFFKSANSKLAEEFKKAADGLAESYRFAHVTKPELLAKYGKEDKVVIYQPPRLQVKLLDTENVYTGAETKDAITKFVQSEIHGLVGHRTKSNAKDFKNPLLVVFYNVDYVRDVKGTNYVRNRVIKVAKKLRDEGLKLNFAISSNVELAAELAEFGIENADKSEKYVVGRGPKGQKYTMKDDYSVDNVEKFARDLVAGNLEEHLKSEEVPVQTEPVKVVVAKNFDDIVNDETKDVLIEFYAPWCGHCKNLVPIYDSLAKTLESESDIVIAKMDATANDVPSQYDVRGFPTLFFVPKGKKGSPMKYDAGREEKDFIKYIAKHSTEPLKGYERNGNKKKNSEL